MTNTHKIFNMELHQVIEVGMDYRNESGYEREPLEVMRVPGGWIYGVGTQNPVFVPISGEFGEYKGVEFGETPF